MAGFPAHLMSMPGGPGGLRSTVRLLPLLLIVVILIMAIAALDHRAWAVIDEFNSKVEVRKTNEQKRKVLRDRDALVWWKYLAADGILATLSYYICLAKRFNHETALMVAVVLFVSVFLLLLGFWYFYIIPKYQRKTV